MKKKIFLVIAMVILAVVATVVGVAASDIISTGPMYEITDAVKAGDVCHEHFVQDCMECEGYGLNGSFTVNCPSCNTRMTLCCSGSCAVDDYPDDCLVSTHPSGCTNYQDLYWNAYICMRCGYYERGYRDGDYHVEAYWHDGDSTCYDHVYCSMSKLSDLINLVNGDSGHEVMTTDGNKAEGGNPVKDPVAAGDYCEIHDIFACDIPHNDVE